MKAYFRVQLICIILDFSLVGVCGSLYKLGWLSPKSHIRLGWDITAAAASTAMEKAHRDGLLPDDRVQLVYRDDKCNSKHGAGMAVELRDADDVDAYLGPPCSSSAKAAGLLASFWNRPMFTHGATDPAITDKAVFSTVVRMAPAFTKMSSAVAALCGHFRWRRVVMISSRPVGVRDVFCDYAARSIEERFRDSEVTLAEWVQFTAGVSRAEIDDILDRISQRGRIVLLCAGKADEHALLLRAKDRGMTDAEYLYISLEHTPPADILTPWDGLNSTYSGRGQHLFEAYRSVIQISLASIGSAETEAFLDKIPAKMAQAPWFYNATLEQNKKASTYTLFMHDIVYLYMLVLDDTLKKGQDPRNGQIMFQNAIGKSFRGISGDVVIDSNGDRDPNYWVYHVNKQDMTYDVWTEIKLTNPEGKRINITKPGRWLTGDGQPPPDVPACGFMGEKCTSGRNIAIGGGTGGAVAILVFVVVVALLHRRHKQEEQLRNMLWKINPGDIQRVRNNGLNSQMSFRSLVAMSTDKLSRVTADGTLTDMVKDDTGNYRGHLITMYPITSAKPTELTREDLVELNAMRQMTHENINQFVGACLEPSKPCFVMAFCSRGSLQDIVNNEDIKLDWLFKISLCMDIINGLQYLQSSVLRGHGNLTSDTCLVDNRWMVKLTGYGMHSLQGSKDAKAEDDTDPQKYRGLFWTSPEILRKPVALRPRNGTIPGDVYSLGVITQEVVHRCLPYDTSASDPREIIEKITLGGMDPYRPELPSSCEDDSVSSMNALIQECWAEDPEARPSLSHVKSVLKGFNKGKTINIMDNMLNMMEKYANNLEDIVQQRTEALVEEKKKTDMLLYSMLPRSVADSLKIGNMVVPESFDSVTIFFSDIVGFTSLSSESTPLQVVDLLNDLYTLFDGIIAQHDVYKVETIGDAYMVVSGLPIRNGMRHSSEIATMALDLLHAVHTQFVVRHQPSRKLLLRIGLHTGPCVTGVVGLKMPRYCLFGDTVNMASRMESNGQALKIHMSQYTEQALAQIGGFHIVERGLMAIKGKGDQLTYWLVGKQGYDKDLPAFDVTA